MPSIIRSLVIFSSGASLVLVAAEPKINADTIEIPVGETSYFQLTDSVPTGKPTSVVRVQNPNREYFVVKVTFEAGENGAKNILRIRNGYDVTVMFALNDGCLHITDPTSANANKPSLLFGVGAGHENSVDVPALTKKIVMCDFTVTR